MNLFDFIDAHPWYTCVGMLWIFCLAELITGRKRH